MTIPRTSFDARLRRRRPATSRSAATELMANYIQEIIKDAIQVGWMSGYSPQFILHCVSDAIHHDGDLEALANAWSGTPEAVEGARP